jgi:hypothetical protein
MSDLLEYMMIALFSHALTLVSIDKISYVFI